jgi:hypothetical protein
LAQAAYRQTSEAQMVLSAAKGAPRSRIEET